MKKRTHYFTLALCLGFYFEIGGQLAWALFDVVRSLFNVGLG